MQSVAQVSTLPPLPMRCALSARYSVQAQERALAPSMLPTCPQYFSGQTYGESRQGATGGVTTTVLYDTCVGLCRHVQVRGAYLVPPCKESPRGFPVNTSRAYHMSWSWLVTSRDCYSISNEGRRPGQSGPVGRCGMNPSSLASTGQQQVAAVVYRADATPVKALIGQLTSSAFFNTAVAVNGRVLYPIADPKTAAQQRPCGTTCNYQLPGSTKCTSVHGLRS